MRAVILANGALSLAPNIEIDDYIIAADGGIANCLTLGLIPTVAIGDFDSTQEENLKELEKNCVSFIKFPERKDETDLELAVIHAIEMGYEDILIIAALGERWDQTIANILLPACHPGVKIKIQDGPQEIHYIHEGEELFIQGQPGDIVSLIPLSSAVKGINAEGLEYPLTDEVLYFGKTRGVSNRLTTRTARIQITKGILLCTVIHHESFSKKEGEK